MNTETQTLCRCCNEPMDSMVQPALSPHQADITLIHCVNDDCPMRYQTVAQRTYATLDLAKYHATEYEADDEPELCNNCGGCLEIGRHWIRVAVDHWRCEGERRFDGD